MNLGGFRLTAGATRRFTYDWDDINLSELAVRRPGGAWQYVVLRSGADTAACCSQLQSDRILIPPLAALPAAPSAVVQAAEDTRHNWRMLWVYLWCFGPLAISVGMWLLLRGSPTNFPDRVSRLGGIREQEA
jgi:hypothetical protein